MRVGSGTGKRIEGQEAAKEPAVESGLGVVVAGFGVALIGSEVQLIVRRAVPRITDVTGLNKSSRSERESLSKGAGHADEEVQAGADCNVAAAN